MVELTAGVAHDIEQAGLPALTGAPDRSTLPVLSPLTTSIYHLQYTEYLGNITELFGIFETAMIEAIVGSEGAERVLLFLTARGEGYASEIASFYDMDVSTVQSQLKRMERDGLLVNKLSGRTRVYRFNPRYALLEEVESLLTKTLSLAPAQLREALTVVRRRPRRAGKSL